MEKVKLTFEKSDNGDRVIIRKDGGFTTHDLQKLTEIVEDLFSEGGAADSGRESEDAELEDLGDENTEQSAAAEDQGGDGGEDRGSDAFRQRVAKAAEEAAKKQGSGLKPYGQDTRRGQGEKSDLTPPAGRGQGAAKTPGGVGITKEGTVDRRTLKGSPGNPDPQRQAEARKVEKALKGGGQPEAGA